MNPEAESHLWHPLASAPERQEGGWGWEGVQANEIIWLITSLHGCAQDFNCLQWRLPLWRYNRAGMSMSIDKCLWSQSTLFPLCSLFEGIQVGFIQKSAVDRSTPGCWMRSFIAKALLFLPGKYLVAPLKGKLGRQIFGHWTDWAGKSRDKRINRRLRREKRKGGKWASTQS